MFRTILISLFFILTLTTLSLAAPLKGTCPATENNRMLMTETVINIIETEHFYKLALNGKAAIFTWTKSSPDTKEAYRCFKESLDNKIPLTFLVDAFSRDICSVKTFPE